MLGLREDVQNADQSFELGLVGGILWDQRGSDVLCIRSQLKCERLRTSWSQLVARTSYIQFVHFLAQVASDV